MATDQPTPQASESPPPVYPVSSPPPAEDVAPSPPQVYSAPPAAPQHPAPPRESQPSPQEPRPQEYEQSVPEPESQEAPGQTPTSQEQYYGYPPQGEYFPNQPEPEYLLLEWMADSRVVRRRSKEYYSSLAVIVLLVSLILFFANQVLLIFVLVAFLFITYVLSTVKAETVFHQITTYGIRYRTEKLLYWSELSRFWVRDNHGTPEIHIEAPGQFANEIILLPANAASHVPVAAEDIIDLLQRYLPYEEPLPSQIDRWVIWLQEKFPLE